MAEVAAVEVGVEDGLGGWGEGGGCTLAIKRSRPSGGGRRGKNGRGDRENEEAIWGEERTARQRCHRHGNTPPLTPPPAPCHEGNGSGVRRGGPSRPIVARLLCRNQLLAIVANLSLSL